VKRGMLSICSTTFLIPNDVEIMAMDAAHRTTSSAHSNLEGLYVRAGKELKVHYKIAVKLQLVAARKWGYCYFYLRAI
jgi:hypothetical protein